MAIKTFTAGSILTASDTNTYLANAGLVYVKSQTVATSPAPSSVTVTDAFSSTYDNYRITITGIVPSAQDSFRIRFGAATANYYGSMYYDQYGGGATATLRTNNASANYLALNQNGVAAASTTIDVISPFLSTYTSHYGMYYGRGFAGWASGFLDTTSSYTSFTILTDGAGTISGGTITVYGYRKA